MDEHDKEVADAQLDHISDNPKHVQVSLDAIKASIGAETNMINCLLAIGYMADTPDLRQALEKRSLWYKEAGRTLQLRLEQLEVRGVAIKVHENEVALALLKQVFPNWE